MKILYALKQTQDKKFLQISESFGDRPRTPEGDGETIDAPKKIDYTLTPEDEARSASLKEAREEREAVESADRDREEREDYPQWEREMEAAYAPPVAPTPVIKPEIRPNPQQRYDLRQQALDQSFVADHFVPQLARASSGRTWEKQPDDHWSLSGLKSAINFTAATSTNMLVVAEDVVKFAGSVAVAGFNTVFHPIDTAGKVANFFRPGLMERAGTFFREMKEDAVTTWDNTPAEGLLGKGVAFVADAVLGAKGLSKLAKLRDNPKGTTATAEATATVIEDVGAVESVAVATGVVEALETGTEALSYADTIRRLNSLSPDMLQANPELAQRAYTLRQDVLRKSRVSGEEYLSQQTYTKEGTPLEKPRWSYLENTDNWTPERIAVQAAEKRQLYEAAVPLSERMPPKTLVLLRGNSGVGKSTTLRRSELPVLRR